MVSLVTFTPNLAILVYRDILFEHDQPLYLWDSNMYRNKDTSLTFNQMWIVEKFLLHHFKTMQSNETI